MIYPFTYQTKENGKTMFPWNLFSPNQTLFYRRRNFLIPCATSVAAGLAQLFYCPSTLPWIYHLERQDSWTPPSDRPERRQLASLKCSLEHNGEYRFRIWLPDRSISPRISPVFPDQGHVIQRGLIFQCSKTRNVLPHSSAIKHKFWVSELEMTVMTFVS